MTTMIDAALAYIAHGWPVLALYSVTDAGCDCGDIRCKSPGKHPLPKYSPDGVHSATLDPDVVMSWEPPYNIGVALGAKANHTLVFDVDDHETAIKLLHPSLGLSDQTGIVVSRRGCHIWFRCSSDYQTFDVNTLDGLKLGNVRANDLYVCVPPSIHQFLRSYKWVGLPKDEWIPYLETTDNPFAYVQTLLRMVDIEIDAVHIPSQGLGDLEDAEVEPSNIPDELRFSSKLVYVRQVLSGTLDLRTEKDRSGKLFKVGLQLHEAAKQTGVSLTRQQVAGVVKLADKTAFGYKYQGHDKEYLRIAAKVLPDGDYDAEEQAGESGGTEQPEQHYTWDAKEGVLSHQGARNMFPVCNFLPQIISDNEIDDGAEPKRTWHVRFTLANGRSTEFVLREKDFKFSNIETAIRKACSSEYIVFAGMYRHLIPAMQQLSVDTVQQRRVPAQTGWIEYGADHVFLLPGAAGAVTKAGIDPSVRIDAAQLDDTATILHKSLAPYGKGVRPPVDSEREEAWDAFRSLLDCGQLEVTVPVVLQVMAGPLASFGLNSSPPLVHVTGQTGTLKTSFSLSALSIFGSFTRETPAPASWSSTANALSGFLHTCKDLTLLIDDYKTSVAGKARGVVTMIQNYADRTTRLRMNTEQEVREAKLPRALILSNGEDVWEQEASATARTVVVRVHRNDIDRVKLRVVQDACRKGKIQLFGGLYLAWLAKQETIISGERIIELRDMWRDKLEARLTTAHLRLPATASTLMAVGDIVRAFIHDEFSEHEKELVKYLNAGAKALLQSTQERAQEVEESSPFQQIARAIMDTMSQGMSCLRPVEGLSPERQRIPESANPQKAHVVGYWKDDPDGTRWAYLTRHATYDWYKREMRKSGDEIGFAWTSFMDEVKTRWEGERFERVRADDDSSKRRRPQLSGVRVRLDGLYALVSDEQAGKRNV